MKRSELRGSATSRHRGRYWRGGRVALLGLGVVVMSPGLAKAADAYLPIVMPITGFLSVEGGSQRNGAVMALEHAPGGKSVDYPIFDTGTSATGAATALDKALSDGRPIAAAVSVFGTEMVAMMPVAAEYKVPLLTISGLAKITESGNPYIFRFLPNDREIKVAHARYVVETLKKRKIALISDTTAYGQGGFALLKEDFTKLGVTPVYEDSTIAPDTKDMSPLLAKVKASGADAIVVHSVAEPMALIVKQARAAGIELPIINSSSIVEPTATALFEPAELKGVCAETPSAPETRATPKIKEWADAYKARFSLEPDGLALGQYDGVMMALTLIAKGAKTPEDLRAALQKETYEGIAMTYKSNGKGDLSHDAEIVCWDGSSRIPKIVAHYAGSEMVLK
ncbi:ABC transporter substrate-binding protein [Bradyrhizobium sp.]|uniref:ABC transporter substrate-binding protein n=1 Tax=Bradyrhizobium sp. TaxID=376 RepID=UPI003C508980